MKIWLSFKALNAENDKLRHSQIIWIQAHSLSSKSVDDTMIYNTRI